MGEDDRQLIYLVAITTTFADDTLAMRKTDAGFYMNLQVVVSPRKMMSVMLKKL